MSIKVLHIVDVYKKGGEYNIGNKLNKFFNKKNVTSNLLFFSGKSENSLNYKMIFDEYLINFKILKNNKLFKISNVIFFHHYLNFSSLLFLLYIKIFTNKKIILIQHNNIQIFGNFLKKIFYIIRNYIIYNFLIIADSVIFLTLSQKNIYKKVVFTNKLLNKKSIVINNFIEEKNILKSKNNFNKNIIFIGRYSKMKGFYDLLNLIKETPNNKYNLIGNSNYISKYNNINNIGFIDNDKINFYLDQNSIFILPSYTEIFPVTILEAMSRGLVIVASDIPGIDEFIKEGINGFLFPVGDIIRMKEIIIYLNNNPNIVKKISSNNLEDIKEYTTNKQGNKYINLLNNVL